MEDVLAGQSPEMFTHRGLKLIKGVHLPQEINQIQDLEIRDSDVFVATYPKSGTIWMQQILLLLQSKGNVDSICKEDAPSNAWLVPWIEQRGQIQEFVKAESPRYRVTHLLFSFMPKELSRRRGKVIYVARNPRDVLVSYYHFYKMLRVVEAPKSFAETFDKFLSGDVGLVSWFDHIKSWLPHKEDLNMLFITYEEMIQDLPTVVRKMAEFLGVDLTQDQLNNVVKYSTFKNMKHISQASYEKAASYLFDHQEGHFMRKGITGDWKNHFTAAQNKLFDEVYEQEMKDFPMQFIWDIKDP